MTCLLYHIRITLRCLVICFLIGQFLYANKSDSKISDSLSIYDYDSLFDKIEDSNQDSVTQSVYLRFFLEKAKYEKNWEEIVNGYKNYLHYSSPDLAIVYADSMILAAEKSKDDALIGSAYLSKGIEYYGQKKHDLALDNYLIANEYISKTKDSYLLFKVKYNIAHIKYYLGFYKEAISLFEECIDYFKNENDRAYLNTLHSLALCYNRIGDFGVSSQFNELGLSEGKRLENDDMESYFIHLEGINNYFKNNYATSIEEITAALPAIIENKDFANETVGYFYIGKSYWALNKKETAMAYFRKVDQAFNDRNYIRTDLRENYELMIDYYKSKNNLKVQLYYVGKLLKADSVLNTNFKYLVGRIHKEYDTKKLLIEKEEIQKKLIKRKKNEILLISAITFLFFTSVYLAYRYFRNKKIYKKRFEELMKKTGKESNTNSESKIVQNGILDINPEAAGTVLKQLEKFELDKKFLDQDWTLVKLSAAFNSNTKYLSKVIFYYRKKKFTEYINDLKVDYIIDLLKNDKRTRNYTNKALAEESGFSSTQRFTNAFNTRTGISPTFFINELKKEITQ